MWQKHFFLEITTQCFVFLPRKAIFSSGQRSTWLICFPRTAVEDTWTICTWLYTWNDPDTFVLGGKTVRMPVEVPILTQTLMTPKFINDLWILQKSSLPPWYSVESNFNELAAGWINIGLYISDENLLLSCICVRLFYSTLGKKHAPLVCVLWCIIFLKSWKKMQAVTKSKWLLKLN